MFSRFNLGLEGVNSTIWHLKFNFCIGKAMAESDDDILTLDWSFTSSQRAKNNRRFWPCLDSTRWVRHVCTSNVSRTWT